MNDKKILGKTETLNFLKVAALKNTDLKKLIKEFDCYFSETNTNEVISMGYMYIKTLEGLIYVSYSQEKRTQNIHISFIGQSSIVTENDLEKELEKVNRKAHDLNELIKMVKKPMDLCVVTRDPYSFQTRFIKVSSLKEASKTVKENTCEMGSSEWCGEDVGYVYYEGKQICRISYNGRIWDKSKEYAEIDENTDYRTLL